MGDYGGFAITYQDIVQAHERIKSFAHCTPVMTSSIANNAAKGQLYFKCENFQRIGAFKFRGAYNALAQFSHKQLDKGVICFSSGNHAQAIALAARMHNTKAVVVMPADAPDIKIEATRGYGAEIVFYDRYKDDREAIGKTIAEERDLTLISSYDHPHVIAGQGTAAKEMFEQCGMLDILIAPIGGGGLLSGCALTAKTLNPTCLVIGVEPEAGNDAQQSWRSGRIVKIDTPQTIADGAQTQRLGNNTFSMIRALADDIVTVSDRQIVEAMIFLAGTMKIIVEPTGCLGLAAVFAGKINLAGKKAGIVLSGGNIGVLRFADLVHAHSRSRDETIPIVIPIKNVHS